MLTRNRLFAVFFCCLVTAAVGFAQTKSERVPSSAAVASGATAIKKPMPTSEVEVRAEVLQSMSRIATLTGQVRRMRVQSIAQNDYVKADCLDAALSKSDTAEKNAKARKGSIDAKLAEKSLAMAISELALLRNVTDRSEAIFAEANSCVGNNMNGTPDNEVTVRIDPKLPPNEGNGDPTTIVPTFTLNPPAIPPTCASCAL